MLGEQGTCIRFTILPKYTRTISSCTLFRSRNSKRDEEMNVLEAGSTMPSMTVLDDSGNSVETGALLGKTLVLWFYPKDDTPG